MDNLDFINTPESKHLLSAEALPTLLHSHADKNNVVQAACDWWVNHQENDRPIPNDYVYVVTLLNEYANWRKSAFGQFRESAAVYGEARPQTSTFEQFLRERHTYLSDYSLDSGPKLEHTLRSLIGESKLWREVISLVRLASLSSVPTLLNGELGTGKAQVAKVIHETGNRAELPFLSIRCQFLSHRHYKFQIQDLVAEHISVSGAEGIDDLLQHFGTIFLADIDQLERELQPVITDQIRRRYLSDSGDQSTQRQPRYIVSTTEDLNLLARQQLFRHDLFLEVAILQIDLPALRHRREDLATLAEHAVDRLAQRYGIDKPTLHADALRRLERHSWPGNLVELRTVLDRVLVRSSKVIRAKHLLFDERDWMPVSSRDQEIVLRAVNLLEKSGFSVGQISLEKLVTFLSSKGPHHFKTRELTDELAAASSTARGYMKKLHDLGFVAKHGDRKTTTWSVIQAKLRGEEE
jgi:DNA-binding NtrC family response regulator